MALRSSSSAVIIPPPLDLSTDELEIYLHRNPDALAALVRLDLVTPHISNAVAAVLSALGANFCGSARQEFAADTVAQGHLS